jgi:FdhD protein
VELDQIAVEEALEIRIAGDVVATCLRTPGHDRELALGYLYSLGVVRDLSEVSAVFHCKPEPDAKGSVVIEVRPAPGATLETDLLERATTQAWASGACGACGNAQLANLKRRCAALPPRQSPLSPSTLAGWLEQLPDLQPVFARTGAVHAAAVARAERPLQVFEDVGRHNAVDKLVGSMLLKAELPARDAVLIVTSRAGFEIVQKACAAGFDTVVCLSAATSLAVETARDFGMTLVGFARPGSFTVYCGHERLALV